MKVAMNICEIRFGTEGDLTHVYVYLEVIPGCLISSLQFQGWHHKTFPRSDGFLPILKYIIDNDDPTLWPLESPNLEDRK